MVAAIAQSKPAVAAAGTPTVALPHVGVGSTLLQFAIESDGSVPGLTQSSRGDAYTRIDSNSQGNLNVAFAVDYMLRAVGGNTTLSNTLGAAGDLVALEITGVATPVQTTNKFGRTVFLPPIPDGIFDGQSFGSQAAGQISTFNPTGGLVFALCVASGASGLTLDAGSTPGWTPLGFGTQGALSYDAQVLTITQASNVSAIWNLTTPGSTIVLLLSLPSA